MDQQVVTSCKKRVTEASNIVARTDLDQTDVVAESKLLRQASHQVHRELVDSIRRLREALGQSRRIAIERLAVGDVNGWRSSQR